MPSYLFEGKLKQITPMIHFQAEEPGACLKGSEVKPKLDRFILEQIENKGESIPDEWIIHTDENNGHRALNYKIMFRAIGEPVKSDEKKYMKSNNWNNKGIDKDDNFNEIKGGYFGNQLGREDKNPEMADLKIKDTVFYKNGIYFQIVCFIPKLMKEIKNKFRGFFLMNNFGTRQHKGYGSFVYDIESENNDASILAIYCRNFFYIHFESQDKWKQLFSKPDKKQEACDLILDDIRILSALMKSGYNLGGVYFKGSVFRYFWNKGIINDKKYFKLLLQGNSGTSLPHNVNYVRSMLGIQDDFKFIKYDKKNKVDYQDGSVCIKAGGSLLKRFNNPVLFKPVEDYLFLIPTKIPDVMFNQKFDITISDDTLVETASGTTISSAHYKKLSPLELSITTPNSFDLVDFLYEFAKEFNKKDDVHNGNKKSFNDAVSEIQGRDAKAFKHLKNLSIKKPKI